MDQKAGMPTVPVIYGHDYKTTKMQPKKRKESDKCEFLRK